MPEIIQNYCSLPKYNPVTHVIFDLDGTILDTEGIYRKVIAQIGAEYGKVYTKQMALKVVGTGTRETATTAVELMELPLTVDEFLVKFKKTADVYIRHAKFMPGAVRIIKHLHSHGIPIAVATSSDEAAVKIKMSKHRDIFDLFHHVVCAGTDPDVKHGKPNPDIFRVCASRFHEKPDPSQCLVFEDAVNGVKAALSAGMQVVMIPDENVPHDLWKLATLKVESFNTMTPELFGLPPFESIESE